MRFLQVKSYGLLSILNLGNLITLKIAFFPNLLLYQYKFFFFAYTQQCFKGGTIAMGESLFQHFRAKALKKKLPPIRAALQTDDLHGDHEAMEPWKCHR